MYTLLNCNFIKKEALTQVFSCEFCEIFKNIVFYRAPRVAASVTVTSLKLSQRRPVQLNNDVYMYVCIQ